MIYFKSTLLIGLFLVTILSSCCEKGADKTESRKMDIIYPAANLNNDQYNPGDQWTLVWSDEFNDSIVSEDWSRQVYPEGNWNREWQKYTDSEENTYTDSGCLVIAARHTAELHDTFNYTSARLHTGRSHSWQYGKIAARMQLPYGNGTWPAFWMMGDNCVEAGGDTEWPFCGEIDIMEFYGSKDNSVLEGNIHFWNEHLDKDFKHDQMGARSIKLKEGQFSDAFHVFEIEWNEKEVIWRLDNEAYATFRIDEDHLREFHQNFYILFNLAIGGQHSGQPDSTTVFPQYLYVDWVRVYKEKEG